MNDSRTRGRKPSLRATLAVTAALIGVATTGMTGAPANSPTSTFTFYRNIGLPKPGGHAGLYAWGAATLNDGSVLIGNYWNLRVDHYAKDGSFLGSVINNPGFQVGQNQEPYGIGVDPVNGDLYLAQATLPKVIKYDANGNYITEWGQNGTTNGKFLYPSQIAVAPDQNVYVADTWAHQIDEYDPNGTFIRSWGTFGSGNGQLKQPHGIAFDSQGRLWVNDEANWRVEVFDQSGNYLFQFGTRGSKDTPGPCTPTTCQFRGNLRGLAIDNVNNRAYVVDAASGRVMEFDSSGASNASFITRWGSLGNGPGQFQDGGRDVTVDGDGNVWVADLGNFRVMKFDPSGNLLLTEPNPAAPPPDGGFNAPRGVAIDASGNIFVTDTYNERIEEFDANANFVRAWGMRGENPGEFNYPRLISVDPTSGNLVVADSDQPGVDKWDANGNLIWAKFKIGSGPVQFRTDYGVAVDQGGNIWVADSQNHRVQELDSNGNFIRFVGSQGTGSGHFGFPRGIAVDADGSIWVSDLVNNNIQHFTCPSSPTQACTFSPTIIGGKKGSGPGQLKNPFGLVADGTYLYVADTDNNRVDIFNDSGTYTYVTSFGSIGGKPQNMYKPQGLNMGPNGALYIADQQNDRIDEWCPGTVTPC